MRQKPTKLAVPGKLVAFPISEEAVQHIARRAKAIADEALRLKAARQSKFQIIISENQP